MKTVVIGAIDLGKTTANMIEQNEGVEVIGAFAPEPTKITASPHLSTISYERTWIPQYKEFEPLTTQKKYRKKNNRKKSKRRK